MAFERYYNTTINMSKQKTERNQEMFKFYFHSKKAGAPISFDTLGYRYGINGETARKIIRRIENKK